MSLRRAVLRSVLWLSPLVAGGCNAIFGITPGTPAGSGGATSTSATSSSSASTGSGGAACAPDRSPPCNADGGVCTPQIIDTESNAEDVAITGDYLFVTTDSDAVIRRLRYDGSDGITIDSTLATTRLVTQGDYVYWTDYYGGSTVTRSGLDGSDVTILTTMAMTDQIGTGWLASDPAGAMVYWTTYNPPGLSRIATGSVMQTATVVLQTDAAEDVDFPVGVALDDTYLYWGDTDGVHRMLVADIGTANPTLEGFAIDTTAPAKQVILSADRVYWFTETGDVRSKAKTDPPAVEPLVHWSGSADPPTGLALDGSFVYWLTMSGLVQKAGLTDSTMTTVAAGPPQNDNTLGSLAVDCGAVYWAIGSTNTAMAMVFRAAKGP